jgi:small subunit ribosomal protein S1
MHTGEPSLNDDASTSSADIDNRSNPLLEWLESTSKVVQVHRGDVLEGKVISIAPERILIDVGCKADGLVAGRELEHMTAEEVSQVHVGDCFPVLVVQPEDSEGNILVSINRARAMRDWHIAEELYASQNVFEACVMDSNKGGVIVNVGRLRGFVPASQLVSGGRQSGSGEGSGSDDTRWNHLISRSLKLKVIEVDKARNRLILSERVATRESRESAKQRLLDELQIGEVRPGVVNSLCEFGAFVDLGGADGLIHLSELSWERVSHPREVLREGQAVQVMVVDVDREKQRIGLSLRRLSPEPWSDVANGLAVGQIVQGTITKVVSFGAFAHIGDNIEGLIHISELSEERVEHPHEVVHEGDVLALKVIRIDADRRRIGLSLKQAREDTDFDWRAELENSHREEDSAEGS